VHLVKGRRGTVEQTGGADGEGVGADGTVEAAAAAAALEARLGRRHVLQAVGAQVRVHLKYKCSTLAWKRAQIGPRAPRRRRSGVPGSGGKSRAGTAAASARNRTRSAPAPRSAAAPFLTTSQRRKI